MTTLGTILAEKTMQALNVSGWIVMLVSVGAVLVLVGYCFYRVLRLPPGDVEEHLKAPLEIDTQDTETSPWKSHNNAVNG